MTCLKVSYENTIREEVRTTPFNQDFQPLPEKNGWLTPKDSNRPFRIDHTGFEDLWSFGNIMRTS